MAEDIGSPAIAPIIIKKKKVHGGPHGGAWKVAYADFVTAMMALFIVLWLLSSSADVKRAVGGYFQDPTGKGKQTGSGLAGTGEALQLNKPDLAQLKDKLQQAVKELTEFKRMKDQIAMSVTGEGLRIELSEGENFQFFEKGKPQPSENGTAMLSLLAKQLGGMDNRILIEGHTDAKPFPDGNGYTNWELSVDRANAARKVMESTGLKPGQVFQVRGFADQDLKNTADPENAANRRISIIIQYKIHQEATGAPRATGRAAGGYEPSKTPKAPGTTEATKGGEHK